MQRLALEFTRPDMTLARDVFAQDGTIMVSAGSTLTERLIIRLRNWGIRSVFVNNPHIELPPVPPALQEETRKRARIMVESAFNSVRRAERFSITEEEEKTVHSVVTDATQDPLAVVHMAHIDRNTRDILSHSINVALLAVSTALSMGISSPGSLNEIALASLLHDIGLLMIPQDLIDRRERLTPEESAIYREHTSWGRIILQQTTLPDSISLVAFEHHENPDGTGYPKQLTDHSMHPFSRIVSAVNTYENLCAGIFEGSGGQAHLAYEAVSAGAGTRFDLRVARALLSRLTMFPAGSLVELTNGMIGVVVSASQAMPHRPLLKILAGPDASLLQAPSLLDLSHMENQTLFVKTVLDDERASRFLSPD